MRLISRNNLAVQSEMAIVRKHFDAALTQAFINVKNEGLSVEMFWELCSRVAGLVLPMAETKKLMGVKQRWMDVATELDLVTSVAMIENNMFAFAHQLVVAERVAKVMQEFSGELADSER
jgi:hypothetical protein